MVPGAQPDALDHLGHEYVKAGFCTQRVARCYAAEMLLVQTYTDFLNDERNKKTLKTATQLLSEYSLESTASAKLELNSQIDLLQKHIQVMCPGPGSSSESGARGRRHACSAPCALSHARAGKPSRPRARLHTRTPISFQLSSFIPAFLQPLVYVRSTALPKKRAGIQSRPLRLLGLTQSGGRVQELPAGEEAQRAQLMAQCAKCRADEQELTLLQQDLNKAQLIHHEYTDMAQKCASFKGLIKVATGEQPQH